MGIFDKLLGRKSEKSERAHQTAAKDPEKLYRHAVELFGQEKFRDAAEILEETARLNPNSAPVRFTLGATYSRIAGEYGSDEEKVRPWMQKSRDCFKKAVDLATRSGGLNEEQLSIARNAVTAIDRVTERDSPSLAEDQRRKIFADFMETHDTEFLLGTNIAQKSAGADLLAMGQIFNRSAGQADAATYAKIGKKYGLSEGQLRAIVEEGKQKKWPFRGVAR
jgi:transposase-like protein